MTIKAHRRTKSLKIASRLIGITSKFWEVLRKYLMMIEENYMKKWIICLEKISKVFIFEGNLKTSKFIDREIEGELIFHDENELKKSKERTKK